MLPHIDVHVQCTCRLKLSELALKGGRNPEWRGVAYCWKSLRNWKSRQDDRDLEIVLNFLKAIFESAIHLNTRAQSRQLHIKDV